MRLWLTALLMRSPRDPGGPSENPDLPWPGRVRAALARRVARRVLGTAPLRALLARSRAGIVDGRGLDEHVAALFALDDLLHGGRHDETVQARRATLAEQAATVEARAPRGVHARRIHVEGAAGPLAARSYEPSRGSSPTPGVVFFHGGGWVTGNAASHDGFCRRLAAVANVRVVSVEYRLAPEHPYPAAKDDALAATGWVIAHASELGIDATRVAVMGDSAGGNLAATVSRLLRNEPRRPALAVLVYPATDATCARPSHRSMGRRYFLTEEDVLWYYDQYLPPNVRRDDADVSPLFAAELRGCPPTLVYVAGFDPLRDEGLAYGARLADAGVPVVTRELATFPHGFINMTGLVPTAADAVTGMAEAVGRSLRAKPVAPL